MYALIRNGKDPRMHVLFDHLQPAIIDKIIDAIQDTDVPKGTDVIKQGSEGDLFYMVKSGHFDISKNALEASIDLTPCEIDAGEHVYISHPSNYGFVADSLSVAEGSVTVAHHSIHKSQNGVYQVSFTEKKPEGAPLKISIDAFPPSVGDDSAFGWKIVLEKSLQPLNPPSSLIDQPPEPSLMLHDAIGVPIQTEGCPYTGSSKPAVITEGVPCKQIKVNEAGPGFAFGELALMYLGCPRKATVTAREDSVVWCLHREAFRKFVLRGQEDMWREYQDAFKACELLKAVSEHDILRLCEAAQVEDFEQDECIITEGDYDDKMFIIQQGTAFAVKNGDFGPVQVMTYEQGDYFGEIALLLKKNLENISGTPGDENIDL